MNLRSLPRRLHRDERGQTILLFTLMFVVLLGFTAMVVDVGIGYWNRRLLQNGVDSAALAGAVSLMNGATTPTVVAVVNAYANANGVTTQELNNVTEPAYQVQVSRTFNDNDTVIVSARRPDDFGLRYFVGAGDTDIVASAAAIIAPVSPGQGEIWPWGLENSSSEPCYQSLGGYGPPPPNPQMCILDGEKLSPGNWGLLELSCRGGNCYRDDIINGYLGTVPPPVSTDPPIWNWETNGQQGVKAGPTGQGTSVRFEWDDQEACVNGAPGSCAALYEPSPGAGLNPDPYNPSQFTNGKVCVKSTACPRVGLIPILSDTYGNGNSSPVHIRSFQCFYLSYADKKTVEGFFLGTCEPSSNGSSRQGFYGQPLDSTGLVEVRLWR